MNKESIFIGLLKSRGILKGVGDDCVSLTSRKNKNAGRYSVTGLCTSKENSEHRVPKNYVLCTDSFIEGSHFKRTWLGGFSIAEKAFLVNISDLVSCNAIPLYALLSISLPKNIAISYLVDIADGIEEICRKYDFYIIGGDTVSSNFLGFNITMIGVSNTKVIGRDAVIRNDYVAYTSSRRMDIGYSIKTLASLQRGGDPRPLPKKLNPNHRNSRFLSPILRQSFIKDASRKINACMDISDGVLSEITSMEHINKLRFTPGADININDPKFKSGEEYELLFSFNKKNLTALKRQAIRHRIRLNVIGKFGAFKKTKLKYTIWH